MRLTDTAIVVLRRMFVDVYGLDNVRVALARIELQMADDQANQELETLGRRVPITYHEGGQQ